MTPIFATKPFNTIGIGDPVVISSESFSRVATITTTGHTYIITLESGYEIQGQPNWNLTVLNNTCARAHVPEDHPALI